MSAGEVSLFPEMTRQFTNDAINNASVQTVKLTSGWLVGGNVANPSATDAAVLLFFDLLIGDVTIATSPRLWTVVIPPASSLVLNISRPLKCRTAISVAAVGGWLRQGSGAVNSDISAHLEYF